MQWRRCIAALLFGVAGTASGARALDVTGHWDAAPFDPNIRQVASQDPNIDDLKVCLPGFGPIGSGHVNGAGTFSISFDPVKMFQAGFGRACLWTWAGTFASDGTSFTGTVTFAEYVPPPPLKGTCMIPSMGPISGTRLGPPQPCCGDGLVDSGESCDPGPVIGGCCNADTCQPESVGHSCSSDSNVCTDDVCDGTGSCAHIANTAPCDAGPCASGACAGGSCAPATPLPAGTFCQTDDDLCTDEACDGTGACVTGPPVDCGPCIECHPSLGCLAPRRPVSCDESGTSSRIDIVDGASDDDDRLTWRWRKGADTSQLDAFGDPLEATTYDVCVFSELLAGGESVVLRKRITPGQTCGGEPCWRSLRRGGFALTPVG